MDRRAAAIIELERRIGHTFANRGLLEQALTHVSVGPAGGEARDNERLEFLGDRVLGLLAAETLIAMGPNWREGELSRRQASLVSGPSCAEVARGIGLGPALRLAGGTTVQGGRANARILGDAMEAVIAAVYLDGGLEAARETFQRTWGEALHAALEEPGKDPKTTLQEWAMGRALPLPAYAVRARDGPAHAPIFQIEVRLPGHDPASGSGSSVRAAEQAAARRFLDRERLSGDGRG
ncbi:MAG: ribonuclease III [Caulobacteraceae bacterium]